MDFGGLLYPFYFHIPDRSTEKSCPPVSPLGLTVRFWSSDTLGEVLYVSIIFTFLEITFNSFLVLCFFFFYPRCSQWHILMLTFLTPVYVPSLIFLSKLKTCAIFPASCGHAIGSRAKWLQQPFSTPSAATVLSVTHSCSMSVADTSTSLLLQTI